MKKFITVLLLLFVSIATFADETKTSILSSVDWSNVGNIVLAIVATAFAGGFAKALVKIKTFGQLLIAFADAVIDGNIDANEKKDLAELVYNLLGKKKTKGGPESEPKLPGKPKKQ